MATNGIHPLEALLRERIVVLDGARVVEVGTHSELVAARGQYAELYGIQAAAYKARGQ